MKRMDATASNLIQKMAISRRSRALARGCKSEVSGLSAESMILNIILVLLSIIVVVVKCTNLRLAFELQSCVSSLHAHKTNETEGC